MDVIDYLYLIAMAVSVYALYSIKREEKVNKAYLRVMAIFKKK